MDIIVHTEVDDMDFIVHTEVDDIDFIVHTEVDDIDFIVHTEVDDIDFIVHTEVDDIDFLDFMVLVPNIEAIRLCLLEFEPFGRSVLVLSNSANLAVPS